MSIMSGTVYQATASAPVNIACIKYWGKRDTKLILPTNSSLSVTLDQDHLRSTTTSRADPAFKKDRLWLNGEEEKIKEGGRLATCIAEMKRLRRDVESKDPKQPKLSTFPVHICSRNNFPTAAGLASSASGFAALDLDPHVGPCSVVSWLGSRAPRPDGSDSLAVEVAPREHWPDIHALICVVSDDKKGTSSTSGMQRTVETSPLLQHRIKHVVPERMKAISKAILDKDFDTRSIIALITEYNRVSVESGGKIKAAYTYDAGPNAVIYAPKENLKEIVELIVSYFPQAEPFKDPFGLFGTAGVGDGKVVDGFNVNVAKKFEVGAVKGLIHTRVGDGPRRLGEEEALLGAEGVPKVVA
ncbi:hypothetical protein EW146_g7039 [Bondarzewia mesenterica]|uniref:Diphosphomevalonate decarboxylase n=1 Tax=Bondarzewia mesenterica TaxID=1095465 RepID=A0A4S4LNR5_9AGAM|nr:hypothetical protein EW146_g7039 [Bondarzewia mesenterica]